MYSSVHHNSLSSLLLIHFTFLASEAFECAIPEPWGTLDLMKYIYRYIDIYIYYFLSVQSLTCVRLFGTPWTAARQASLVHHQLPKFAQTHVHQVSDTIQPSHPLLSPSPSNM